MTIKEMAEYLNGKEYYEIGSREKILVKEEEMLVIFGHPDEIVKGMGSFNIKTDAWEEPVLYLNKEGFFNGCPYGDTKCVYCKEALSKYEQIITKITEDDNGIYITFDTEIEHETFNLYDSNSLCCIGIVIDIHEI